MPCSFSGGYEYRLGVSLMFGTLMKRFLHMANGATLDKVVKHHSPLIRCKSLRFP